MKKNSVYPIKMNRILYFLMASTLAGFVSCSTNGKTPDSIQITSDTVHLNKGVAVSTKQFEASNMKLGELENKNFYEIVNATGMFDVPPENLASVSSYFGGTVKDIHLLPGEKVVKGQTLFTLENPEYIQIQQEYLEAKGQLSYLKSDYERQKNLVKDHISSQKVFLKAESDYTVTNVKVMALGEKLKLMNINPEKLTVNSIHTTINVRSPLDGYVTEVTITKGSYLQQSQKAITIVDTDHLHLELTIFEKDISKVQIGQPIVFSIQNNADKTYEASVHLINKTVDAENRTVGIHGHLNDEKLTDRFNPGMYVEAKIYTSTEMSLSLPLDAVVEQNGNQFVFVLKTDLNGNFTFEKTAVKTGLQTKNDIQILNATDFPKNTRFLVRGAFNLVSE